MPHDGVAEDFAPSDVRRGALASHRGAGRALFEFGPNAANLLVPSNKKKDIRLVPIDHGFCLPEVLSIEWFDWCWIDWKAISEPVDPRSRLRYWRWMPRRTRRRCATLWGCDRSRCGCS